MTLNTYVLGIGKGVMMLRRKMALTPLFIVKGFVAGIASIPKHSSRKRRSKKRNKIFMTKSYESDGIA